MKEGPVPCWTLSGPEGHYLFCDEPCALGWLLDREMGREEAEEEIKKAAMDAAESVNGTAKSKKEKLVGAVEMVLDACHDFLDEECENATP